MTSIQITNELSPTGTAITIREAGGGAYFIHVGDKLYFGDLAKDNPETLVHEMTHVWQYHIGTLTSAHGLVAHLHYGILGRTNDLYKYDVHKDSWNDMGFEGQAQLVEEWFDFDSMSQTTDRFVFVKKVLYSGDAVARELTLDELRRPPDAPEPSEIREPDRHVSQNDPAPMMSDTDLLEILQRRYQASDIKGLAARVARLDDYFGWLFRYRLSSAQALAARLGQVRRSGDQLSQAFHDNLSRATVNRLLKTLKGLK